MSGVNSSDDEPETRNTLPNNVHHNKQTVHGMDEPYAIVVPAYRCKLCKYGPMTKTRLNIHSEVKHNSPPEFDEEASNRVQCSSCGAEIFTKNFSKHKARVHHSNLVDITSHERSQPYAKRVENIEEPRATDDEIAMKCKVCGEEVTEKRLANHFAVHHQSFLTEFTVKSDATCRSQVKEKHLKNVQVPIDNREPSQVVSYQVPRAACLSTSKESESPKNDVHQNQEQISSQREGIDEPYAIDVPVYRCKLCKAKPFSETLALKKHFESKHNNLPLDFDERFGKRVQCSSCGANMFTKNFKRHKARVHTSNLTDDTTGRKSSQRCCNKKFGDVSNSFPYPIDMQAMRCKVCGAECKTDRILKRHFAVHHEGVSIEFVVGISYRFVRCSACKVQVKKRHFIRHTNRCICRTNNRTETVKPLNSTGSLQVIQMTNYGVKQESLECEFDSSLTDETLPNDKCGMKDYQEHRSQSSSFDLKLTPRLFGCRICDAENILEQNKMKHFLANHSIDSNQKFVLNDHFYPLNSKHELARLRCQICRVEFNENHFQRHMRRVHSKSFATSEKKPSPGYRSGKSSPNERVQGHLISVKVYKCLACDARGIMEPNLLKHHLKKHTAIPIEINIFKMDGKILRKRCNICQRVLPEGQLKKHKKRSHFNKKYALLEPIYDIPRYSKVFNRTRIQDTEPVRTELHKCTKCSAVVSKDNLQIHRKNHKVPLSVELFHLIGIKDVIKCTGCLRFIEPETFLQHLKRHSALKFVSTDGKPLLSPEPAMGRKVTHKSFVKQRKHWNYDMNFVELYKCGSCDTHGISKRNLLAHHSRVHNFPIDRNNFKVHALRQKISCDCCQKRYMEGRQTKHHLKACLQGASAIEMVLKEQRKRRGVEISRDEQTMVDDDVEECDN